MLGNICASTRTRMAQGWHRNGKGMVQEWYRNENGWHRNGAHIQIYIYIYYMYIATEHFSTEGKSCTAQDDRPPATKHLCLESFILCKKSTFLVTKSKERFTPPSPPLIPLSTRTPVFFNRQFIKVCVNKSEKHRLNLSGS